MADGSNIKALYRDLIRLRRNWWNNTRGLRGQHLNVFHADFEAKVLALHYRGYAGDFGDRGYDTTADGGPNQGMPVSGNVGLGPYSLLIYSQ